MTLSKSIRRLGTTKGRWRVLNTVHLFAVYDVYKPIGICTYTHSHANAYLFMYVDVYKHRWHVFDCW